MLEMRLRFSDIGTRRQQRDFAGDTMHLSGPHSFVGRFNCRQRLVDMVPTIAIQIIEGALAPSPMEYRERCWECTQHYVAGIR